MRLWRRNGKVDNGPGLLDQREARFNDLVVRHMNFVNELEALVAGNALADLNRRVDAIERALRANFSIEVEV